MQKGWGKMRVPPRRGQFPAPIAWACACHAAASTTTIAKLPAAIAPKTFRFIDFC
jgi:hypothetical protein